MAMLSFADGSASSIVYSGNDRFDSDELHHWIGESGQPKVPKHGLTRQAPLTLTAPELERQARSELYGCGGIRSPAVSFGASRHQAHFGVPVVTCVGGDMRTKSAQPRSARARAVSIAALALPSGSAVSSVGWNRISSTSTTPA